MFLRISADLAKFWYVCLSEVFHHLKCLAVLIPDTWGDPEHYPISPMWFELQLIWLNFLVVTFWACLSGYPTTETV